MKHVLIKSNFHMTLFYTRQNKRRESQERSPSEADLKPALPIVTMAVQTPLKEPA